MHVNEQTTAALRASMRRAGFTDVRVELGQWVFVSFVPSERAQRLLQRLARVPLARRLVLADIFGWGIKP